ncbi:hypothetical protein EVAR_55337_1 [Eumeta japonica]|uniref:Uncharacterized protein n=1 Tax=Eumeta variegata TaxID=151549 RepID=A0A4C1ZQS8_EUMVA|nr:hypothetical protein EVAR_55337_1 [Eumeta japonica]
MGDAFARDSTRADIEWTPPSPVPTDGAFGRYRDPGPALDSNRGLDAIAVSGSAFDLIPTPFSVWIFPMRQKKYKFFNSHIPRTIRPSRSDFGPASQHLLSGLTLRRPSPSSTIFGEVERSDFSATTAQTIKNLNTSDHFALKNPRQHYQGTRKQHNIKVPSKSQRASTATRALPLFRFDLRTSCQRQDRSTHIAHVAAIGLNRRRHGCQARRLAAGAARCSGFTHHTDVI